MTIEISNPYNNLLIAIECLKSILSKAPACYNTCECPLKGGDGFDQGCSYCAYLKAHIALKKIGGKNEEM